jgi:hypothetical protein
MITQPVPSRDELRAYRDRTIALLRRYFMLSIETGRLPSLLGREFFRAKCSSYRLVTFEDAVIFVRPGCYERDAEPWCGIVISLSTILPRSSSARGCCGSFLSTKKVLSSPLKQQNPAKSLHA